MSPAIHDKSANPFAQSSVLSSAATTLSLAVVLITIAAGLLTLPLARGLGIDASSSDAFAVLWAGATLVLSPVCSLAGSAPHADSRTHVLAIAALTGAVFAAAALTALNLSLLSALVLAAALALCVAAALAATRAITVYASIVADKFSAQYSAIPGNAVPLATTILLALCTTAPVWLGGLANAWPDNSFVVSSLMQVSPLTYFSASVDAEILRTPWLYQNTPWGGLRFNYPDPWTTSTLCLAATALFLMPSRHHQKTTSPKDVQP